MTEGAETQGLGSTRAAQGLHQRGKAALIQVWEACNRICSKRLAPFLAEMVTVLEQAGELRLPQEVQEHLVRMSPATIDRLLHTHRHRRPRCTTKPGTLLKQVIPEGFVSLNSACRGTNTKGDKPFDHVMLRPAYTTELDRQFGLEVVNLCERFPGPGPCGTSAYSAQFSDHNPIVFRLNPSAWDDD